MRPRRSQSLPPAFYDREADLVAPELLGARLVRELGGRTLVGRIVEVEAYLGPHDLAAHSSKGRTPRTDPMFGPPGRAYVYLIYGMHHCLNAVTGPGHHPSAVLIRALEPLMGIEGRTDGPGRLCKAMAIDRDLNRHDLASGELRIEAPGPLDPTFEIVRGPRVGVDYSGDWADAPLRFAVEGNPHVSKARGRALLRDREEHDADRRGDRHRLADP